MNPISKISQWLGTQDNTSAYRSFIESQRNLAQSDTAFFPHTSNNPYDPWYKKLRLALLGETLTERNLRIE